jgi:SAM-dependent methyltransferase
VQDRFEHGDLDAVICQWDCTDEGFSLVNKAKPVTIVPLRSPFTPGQRVQIEGRPHRPGQVHPVYYQEFHAHSDELVERIDNFVRDGARKRGKKIKSSWAPTLFHEDCRKLCDDKERFIQALLTSRNLPIARSDDLNIDSLMDYAARRLKPRVIEQHPNEDFGSGWRQCIRYVGMDYEDGFAQGAQALGDDFNRDDILFHSPGRINYFLSKMIMHYKQGQAWKIADLGCSTSAPFAQAHLLNQALGGRIQDTIVSVDGLAEFISAASYNVVKQKDWLEAAKQLRIPGYTQEQVAKAVALLANEDLKDKVSFLWANIAKQHYGTGYDAVVASRCLHYNDQNNNRDIEKIVLGMNKALKPRGHSIIVLAGGGNGCGITEADDIQSLREILGDYHFDIEDCRIIEGKSEKNKIVLSPFPYLHAIKNGQASGLIERPEQECPKMYRPLVEVLTGGKRVLEVPSEQTAQLSAVAASLKKTREPKENLMPAAFYDNTGAKVR